MFRELSGAAELSCVQYSIVRRVQARCFERGAREGSKMVEPSATVPGVEDFGL